MTLEKKLTWVCDCSTCKKESRIFHNEYNEQPIGWAQFNIIGKGEVLHFCPDCVEAIMEVFKVGR